MKRGVAWRGSLALHRAISRIRPSSLLLAVFSSRSFHPRNTTTRHGHAHQPREEHATGWSAVRIGQPRMFIAAFSLLRAAPRLKRGARAPRGNGSRQFASSHGTRLFQRSESSAPGSDLVRTRPTRTGMLTTGARSSFSKCFHLDPFEEGGHGISGKAIDRPACPSARLEAIGNCRGVSDSKDRS